MKQAGIQNLNFFRNSGRRRIAGIGCRGSFFRNPQN